MRPDDCRVEAAAGGGSEGGSAADWQGLLASLFSRSLSAPGTQAGHSSQLTLALRYLRRRQNASFRVSLRRNRRRAPATGMRAPRASELRASCKARCLIASASRSLWLGEDLAAK